MNNDDESFNKCLNELQRMYSENPKLANKKAKELLREMERSTKTKNQSNDIDMKATPELIVAIVIIFLTGFLNLSTSFIYVFGFIFLMAGLFVGMKVKGFGLIFLFSHGMTGLGLMMAALLSTDFENLNLSNVLENPILQDYGTKLQTYVGLMICLVIGMIVYVVIYNLNDSLQKKKYSILVPLVIIEVILLMCAFIYKWVPLI